MLILPETRIQLYNNFNMLYLVVLNLRPCRILHIIYLHMSCPICTILHGVTSWKAVVLLWLPFQLLLYSFCAHSHGAVGLNIQGDSLARGPELLSIKNYVLR